MPHWIGTNNRSDKTIKNEVAFDIKNLIRKWRDTMSIKDDFIKKIEVQIKDLEFKITKVGKKLNELNKDSLEHHEYETLKRELEQKRNKLQEQLIEAKEIADEAFNKEVAKDFDDLYKTLVKGTEAIIERKTID